MTDKLRDAEREAFEHALASKPDARFWNTADAMFWAWQARAALAHQDAQNAADEVWRKLFWQAALKLKCLPSSYPDANGHVLRAIDRLMGSENAQQDAQAVPQGDKGTPGAWFVRKLVRDGELKDCFVAAPSFDGMPYDAEILGDDEYRDGVERKLADCQLIVAAVNALRAAPTPPAQRVALTDDEIEDLARGKSGHSDFARAVIEAYERKNGIK